jgi:hypothetical protein
LRGVRDLKDVGGIRKNIRSPLTAQSLSFYKRPDALFEKEWIPVSSFNEQLLENRKPGVISE